MYSFYSRQRGIYSSHFSYRVLFSCWIIFGCLFLEVQGVGFLGTTTACLRSRFLPFCRSGELEIRELNQYNKTLYYCTLAPTVLNKTGNLRTT